MDPLHIDAQIVVAVLCVGMLAVAFAVGLVSDWVHRRRQAKEG